MQHKIKIIKNKPTPSSFSSGVKIIPKLSDEDQEQGCNYLMESVGIELNIIKLK